jgi:hypothetical protein
MSADHMRALRSLAVERAVTSKIARFAVMNIAYGVKNLEAHMHGDSVRKFSYAETGTKVMHSVAAVCAVS